MTAGAIPHDAARLSRAWGLGQDEFLGPHAVADVFSIEGRDGEYDHVFEWEPEEAVLWSDGEGYEVRALADFEPATVVLVRDGRTVGFYMGGQLWIDPDHRGRGIAPDMILACIAWSGGLPFRQGSGMGFSERGIRAHADAHGRAVALAVEAGLDVPSDVAREYGLDAQGPAAP